MWGLKLSKHLRISFACALLIHLAIPCNAQMVVGLDNWFNHETNSKTGLPYHYLWNDTALSGFSQWGQIFTTKGASITTISRPYKKALSELNIYILVDPDTTAENPSPNYIVSEDANAIETWVKEGGVLLILANDYRNCEFTHLNQLSYRFGIQFDHSIYHKVPNDQWEMGAFNTLPDQPIFNKVRKLFLKEIASISITTPARSVLTQDGQTFMAECNYGKGFVFAVGDPWIYNEYIDHRRLPKEFDNLQAAENLTDYLLKHAIRSNK